MPCQSPYKDERQMNLSYVVLLDMWNMFGQTYVVLLDMWNMFGQKFLSFIVG